MHNWSVYINIKLYNICWSNIRQLSALMECIGNLVPTRKATCIMFKNRSLNKCILMYQLFFSFISGFHMQYIKKCIMHGWNNENVNWTVILYLRIKNLLHLFCTATPHISWVCICLSGTHLAMDQIWEGHSVKCGRH
jgi:hypothetical protein